MKCPICNQEMPATMKFVPNDKVGKSVKADHFQEIQGYSCEKCKKIVAIASIEQKWF